MKKYHLKSHNVKSHKAENFKGEKFKLMHKRLWLTLGFAYLGLSFNSFANPLPAGQMIFTESKCINCHTIAALKIEIAISEDDDIETDDDIVNVTPPDLSNVGNRHEPAFFAKWLQREARIEGRKHKIKFKGSKADLKTLTDWLATLKNPEK